MRGRAASSPPALASRGRSPRYNIAAGNGARPRITSAAFSATIMVGALVLHDGTNGITEASTTRRPSRPRNLSSGVVTASGPLPIAQVPTGWWSVLQER